MLIGLLILGFAGLWTYKKIKFTPSYIVVQPPSVGQEIDSLNGVFVFYNGKVGNVTERNTTADGYNLGKKYQCVEFVKRYYYEHLNHKMPDSWGDAKDFFDNTLADGQKNRTRNLTQFTNQSKTKPKVDDLLIFDGTITNKFGHVAIISKVMDNKIEIIQQNPGPYGKSRETFPLDKKNGKWEIENKGVLGWLRKE